MKYSILETRYLFYGVKEMKKIAVMTVLGTRPEIIRLSRVIPKLEKYFDYTLVHTGKIMIMN